MDWEAEIAAHKLDNTGNLTVVVQDNGSLHTSLAVQEKWLLMGEKRIIYLLPTQILLRNEPD